MRWIGCLLIQPPNPHATNHVKLDKGGVVGLITKCFCLVSDIVVVERGQTTLNHPLLHQIIEEKRKPRRRRKQQKEVSSKHPEIKKERGTRNREIEIIIKK